jgi:peptidyl-prolyl cis-trans isomerase B (cyclophilin B)
MAGTPFMKLSLLTLLSIAALGMTRVSAADPVPDKEAAVITTSEGQMVLELWPSIAPKHVESFKSLIKKGFYNGTAFHRVIEGFMIQGGDPLTKDESKSDEWGTGGPGYTVPAEFSNQPHVRGTLSMARTSDPNSAGSQFFICHGRAESLDGKYTVFGKLIKGDDVLEKIATTRTSGPGNRPVKRMNIESIKLAPLSEFKK